MTIPYRQYGNGVHSGTFGQDVPPGKRHGERYTPPVNAVERGTFGYIWVHCTLLYPQANAAERGTFGYIYLGYVPGCTPPCMPRTGYRRGRQDDGSNVVISCHTVGAGGVSMKANHHCQAPVMAPTGVGAPYPSCPSSPAKQAPVRPSTAATAASTTNSKEVWS